MIDGLYMRLGIFLVLFRTKIKPTSLIFFLALLLIAVPIEQRSYDQKRTLYILGGKYQKK